MPANYLRNRPFLCVEITYRANPAKVAVEAPKLTSATRVYAAPQEKHVHDTRKKGWQHQNGAMQAFDRVVILDRVNRPEKFHVIIDVINSEVIRNSTGLDPLDLRVEYMSRYKDDIKQALTIWATREASNMQGIEKALAKIADAEVATDDGAE